MENSSKTKILCITRAYSKNAGGMERLSYEMIEALQNDPNFDLDVLIHTGKRSAAPWFMVKSIIPALLKARKADVIHLGDPLLSKIGWFIKLFYTKPVVVTVHGLDILYPNLVYRLYLRLYFRNFDKYIAISQHVKDLLAHYIPIQKIDVIIPGITDEYYDPAATREQLNLVLHQSVNNKKVLFTVGRLVKRKGHAWFVKNVLPKLPENVVYAIAGTGPEREAIEAAAYKASVEDRVILLGKISAETLQVLLNTIDAFIQPNISVKHDAEGFGLVLLEAALCERPVFAARLEGMSDAIHDGKNGILLPSEDATAWVKALTEFLQQRSQPASAARSYTLSNFVDNGTRIIEYFLKW